MRSGVLSRLAACAAVLVPDIRRGSARDLRSPQGGRQGCECAVGVCSCALAHVHFPTDRILSYTEAAQTYPCCIVSGEGVREAQVSPVLMTQGSSP